MQDCGEDRAAEAHFVLIPSYNSGARFFETIAAMRRCWRRVCVVIDGRTSGIAEVLAERCRDHRNPFATPGEMSYPTGCLMRGYFKSSRH